MSAASLEAVIDGGRLERVRADPSSAGAILDQAKIHLETARTVAASDPAGAFQLLYDGARKAVGAHMLASGIRARASRPGAHQAIALYAQVTLVSGAFAEDIAALDRMRRLRNRVEYDVWDVGEATVRDGLERARGIVAAVEERWPRAPS